MLLMAWSAGDSLPERFEVARGVYVACCPKRRRPGQSFSGFEKALNIISLQLNLGNDPELYYITIFGSPDTGEPWSWRWER